MFVLDSDTLTLSLQGNPKIARRILAARDGEISLPAIVVEEQLRGRMAYLSSLNPVRVSDSPKVPLAYDLLLKTFHDLQRFSHLAYTVEMEALYQSWPAAVKRAGTRDCRIAATAIVHGFTVVTCNQRDFQPIPGVKTLDWSQ
jgi:tRNA(fMet)-specific endonuclease VapC